LDEGLSACEFGDLERVISGAAGEGVGAAVHALDEWVWFFEFGEGRDGEEGIEDFAWFCAMRGGGHAGWDGFWSWVEVLRGDERVGCEHGVFEALALSVLPNGGHFFEAFWVEFFDDFEEVFGIVDGFAVSDEDGGFVMDAEFFDGGFGAFGAGAWGGGGGVFALDIGTSGLDF
jgi:hypothetical protein